MKNLFKSHEARLLNEFLVQYICELSNNSCNGFELPPDWTTRQKNKFAKESYDLEEISVEDQKEMHNFAFNVSVLSLLQHKFSLMFFGED